MPVPVPDWIVLATNSGGGSSPPTPGVAGGDVSAITVTGFIDPISAAITLTIGVTPPLPIGTFIGCHIYLEVPDQSSAQPQTVGASTVGGTNPVTGTWTPIDCGKQVYVASQQPWTLSVPGPPGVDPTKDTPARIYCVSFSTGVENQLVQANQPGASPNQIFTLVSLASGSPTSGTNITGLNTITGAQVGIVATALAPVNVSGKLETPVEVLVTDIGTAVGWSYQLVLTYAGQDPTLPANQFVMTAVQTQGGQVQAPADGVSIPHSFIVDTPTTVTMATVWLQAGLVDASGKFQGNNIVPGITPQFGITFGSTVGTTDASALITSTIAASMAIVSGLFGVAAAGITNSLLGSGAVATINVQNLAITNPLLASLAVQAANLASSSVTATAIASLAVGTGAIQTAAITNALIANLAVSGAQIQSATITGANIASATIGGANIGTATIAQANMASASIGTAQIQALAVTNAKINDLSASKITAGTITATIGVTAGTFTGSTLVLNAAGITTSVNNSTVLGTFLSGLIVASNSSPLAAFVYDGGFGVVDNDGNLGFGIAAINVSATTWIVMTLYNTGTPSIVLSSQNGTISILGNQVLSTRVVSTPATLSDVIAVLQHHGLSN